MYDIEKTYHAGINGGLFNLPAGTVQLALGAEYRKDYEHAIRARASALVRLRAARACCHCQDTDRAGALLKPWRSWTPMSDEALQLDLAQVLVLHGDMPAAAEVLEHLLLHRTREQPEAVLLLASPAAQPTAASRGAGAVDRAMVVHDDARTAQRSRTPAGKSGHASR
ncbi:hypothetical protein [Rhodanobacter lindaniclasticus]